MPELPEVETVRRGLEPVLAGQRLKRVKQNRPDLRFPFPDRFAARLKGRTIETLSRRAKYLIAHLSGGEALVMHLGMSGRFLIEENETAGSNHASSPGAFAQNTGNNPKHDHVVFETAAGARVTYNDARRFGYMLLVKTAEMDTHPMFCNLGPEPLGNSFNAAYLAGRAQSRKSDLKAFLMDQRVVAGLGNIYVCEALHRAGLSPDRQATSLATKTDKPAKRAETLVATIRTVLTEAIAAGGSTLRDYQRADGSLGYFQHDFTVYGREGEPCAKARCKGRIARAVHSGRSTFHCPKCQK